jgi:RNA polymerase sigma-70 factor (ECF subfamily)
LGRKITESLKTLDKATFEETFRTYFTPLCSFAQKYIHDIDEAKDIVHNVFINLWNKRDEIGLDTSLKSYLFQGVHNRSLNYIRDHKKLVQFDAPQNEAELGGYIESNDHLESEEAESRINRALDELPDKCREIFLMNRFDGLKYREIAAKLNISIKTVETQMSRALKSLRERLSDMITVLIFLLLNNL